MRYLIISIAVVAGAVSRHAAGEPGIIKGADEFEFVYRVKLPEITGTARIWIPLAKTDAFQTVSLEKLNIPMKWDKVQDRDYGNDICVVNAQPQDSGKTIELRYKVVRKEKAAYPCGDADAARPPRTGRPYRFHCIDRRGERDRKGTRRPADSRAERTPQRSVCRDKHGRDPPRADRKRALRS